MTTALVCPNPRVLVFSKTAAFRHDSIPEGIKAIQELGQKNGFKVEATEDASVFTGAGLAKFDCIVFLSTTGDVLNDVQQKAMEQFVESGGGFVGVHAAADCEYDWPWYGKLVGAYFDKHPAIQEAVIKVEDKTNPSTEFLPDTWTRTDEWYNFRANPRPEVEVLATLDESSYQGGTMNGDHPIMWCHGVGKGRSWYTNLGHRVETYHEELFLKSLYEGILWTCQAKTPSGALPIVWKANKGWTNENGVLSNGAGRQEDLVSSGKYGDQFVHTEFKLEKGSNSGVYLQGEYEIQIFDSFGKPLKDITFADCGGIYERFRKVGPGFEGTAPLRNAVKRPGEWNTYDILFRAPRFDAKGKKTENAVVVEVRLNGIVIQHGVALTGPTGGSMSEKESSMGPLRFQGDHGPVVYRNTWIMPMSLSNEPAKLNK